MLHACKSPTLSRKIQILKRGRGCFCTVFAKLLLHQKETLFSTAISQILDILTVNFIIFADLFLQPSFSPFQSFCRSSWLKEPICENSNPSTITEKYFNISDLIFSSVEWQELLPLLTGIYDTRLSCILLSFFQPTLSSTWDRTSDWKSTGS